MLHHSSVISWPKRYQNFHLAQAIQFLIRKATKYQFWTLKAQNKTISCLGEFEAWIEYSFSVRCGFKKNVWAHLACCQAEIFAIFKNQILLQYHTQKVKNLTSSLNVWSQFLFNMMTSARSLYFWITVGRGVVRANDLLMKKTNSVKSQRLEKIHPEEHGVIFIDTSEHRKKLSDDEVWDRLRLRPWRIVLAY